MTRDELALVLIDKMLNKHGKDCAFVLENPIIDGIEWYQYFTWTEEEEQEFKAWAVALIKNTLRCTKKQAEREYDIFHLNYGLRTV